MGEDPRNYSKAEHYRKFMEWKNGPGAHWFTGLNREPTIDEIEKAREREIYSIHSLCPNGEG
jgi:hypothetical protein